MRFCHEAHGTTESHPGDECGISGGEEDGVDCCDVSKDLSENVTIVAVFGGVYKGGNVKLLPVLLEQFQKYASEKVGQEIPLLFVFDGGSGSEKHHIATALGACVVKMNVDSDTQWAYWDGIRIF